MAETNKVVPNVVSPETRQKQFEEALRFKNKMHFFERLKKNKIVILSKKEFVDAFGAANLTPKLRDQIREAWALYMHYGPGGVIIDRWRGNYILVKTN
ncbi:MAG: hypothetical protein KA260_05105 [Burkholderiales bacterium]|nr:hypothetical protein [Burkholderiales bacterium]